MPNIEEKQKNSHISNQTNSLRDSENILYGTFHKRNRLSHCISLRLLRIFLRPKNKQQNNMLLLREVSYSRNLNELLLFLCCLLLLQRTTNNEPSFQDSAALQNNAHSSASQGLLAHLPYILEGHGGSVFTYTDKY